MRCPWHGPVWWLLRGFFARVLRHATRATVHGVMVYCDASVDDPRRTNALGRVAAALSLVETHDPRRLKRLREGSTVLLLYMFGKNMFVAPANVIVLDLLGIESKTDRHLASTIVHESTHARLWLAGVAPNRSTIEREERRCIEEQIAFVRRLPGTNPDAFTTWERQMRDLLQTHWWERRNRIRAFADGIAAYGDSPLFVRLLRALGR
jgi:hypothetical protein